MTKSERIDEFVTLYTQHSLRLRGSVRAMVPEQSDAEDVFQEVGRTLWAKFDSYEEGTNFLAWALSVARFKIMQYRRAKARLPVNMSDMVFDLIADDLEQSAEESELGMQYLHDCLSRLSESDRAMIKARYQHGQSTKSLAASLGRSGAAIYRTMRRIHRLLLLCIQERIAEEGARS